MSAINATFSMDSYRTNVLTWRLFLASSMKEAIHLGPDFLTISEIYKNTKFENIWSEFNITQKLVIEHSEEIMNMKCLEYSSPSWTRSILANDQAVKWAKAKVCVYANSVLCVGQVKGISGATERWKGQFEDLKRYSSYQNAVGLDGEPIEFEWKIFQDFRHYHFFARSRTTWRQRPSSQKTSRTGSSSCQCSTTLCGKRKMRIPFRKPKKSGITP